MMSRIRIAYLAFLFGGSTTGLAQSAPSGPAVIVFVHGRNQPVDSLAAVRQVFIGSFQQAQKDWLGETIVPDDDLAFVWYADAIDPNSDRLPTTVSCNYAEDYSAAAEARRADIRNDLLALAKALHLDGLALRILTGDTYKYLSSTASRCEADSRLSTELEGRKLRERPLIVVAHSMGGIVSFESIKQNAESLSPSGRLEVLRFVTIGTQVGLPIILQGLFGSYVTRVGEPNTIRSWRNFTNKGDKLAFTTRASFMATDDSRLPVDISINTPDSDRHSAAHYLADRKVLRAILWTWCGSQTSELRPAKCTVVESEGDVH